MKSLFRYKSRCDRNGLNTVPRLPLDQQHKLSYVNKAWYFRNDHKNHLIFPDTTTVIMLVVVVMVMILMMTMTKNKFICGKRDNKTSIYIEITEAVEIGAPLWTMQVSSSSSQPYPLWTKPLRPSFESLSQFSLVGK